MDKIKLIITDDNDEFREALKNFLTLEFPVEIIGEAANGKEFLKLSNIYEADIILMDIMMPEINGIEATKNLLLHSPKTKVIAVTMHAEKAYLAELIKAGFKGCIFKNNLFEEIKTAITQVKNNKLYFDADIKI